MGKRGDGSQDKLASGLLRGAAVSGLATGLVAAPLGGVGTANASCVSVGGFFSLGSGCTSTPLSFALVLGNGTANAQGLLTGAVAIGNATFADARGFLTGAIATGLTNTAPGPFPPQTDVRSAGALSLAYGGGTDMIVRTNGTLNFAVAQGGRYAAQAGGKPSDFGNVALGLGFGRAADPNEFAAVAAGNIAPNGPSTYFNLAVNLGDDGNVQTTGFANSVLNIFGNRNTLATSGMFNNATNFFGDDNVLTAAMSRTRRRTSCGKSAATWRSTSSAAGTTSPPAPRSRLLRRPTVDSWRTLRKRSDRQPAGHGYHHQDSVQCHPQPHQCPRCGSTQRNRVGLNSTGSNTDELAASSTQGNRVRPGLNAASNRPETTSLGGSLRESVSKKFSDPASSSSGSSRGTSSSNAAAQQQRRQQQSRRQQQRRQT